MSLALRKKYLMSLVQSGGVSPRLPSAYQEVEYIQSSGTQYIDTGYIPNDTSQINLEAQVVSYTQDDCICGNNYSDQGFLIQLGFSGANNPYPTHFRWMPTCISNTYATARLFRQTQSVDTNKHTFIGTINSIKIDNATYTSYFSAGKEGYASATLYLFTTRGQTSHPSIKVYSCQLRDNDVLIRDFVPCYRKADGEIGLYDLVNDVFYTNQGSGTFTCGVPIIYDNRYQQVEYIGNTGNSYIDTGVQSGSAVGYEVKAMPTTTPNADQVVLGARVDTNRYWLDFDDSGDKDFLIGYNNYYRVLDNSNNIQHFSVNAWNVVQFNKANDTKIFVNGTQYTLGTISPAFDNSKVANIYLFRANYSTAFTFVGRIAYATIYNNGTKVREFVPVYRKSDNEIGLLDIVNDVFYTNQGAGVFTKGGNL